MNKVKVTTSKTVLHINGQPTGLAFYIEANILFDWTTIKQSLPALLHCDTWKSMKSYPGKQGILYAGMNKIGGILHVSDHCLN